MRILNTIASNFSGKKETRLDKNIPIMYIIHLCVDYGFMLLRGIREKLFIRECGSALFIGKRTRLIVKKMMRFGNNVKIGKNCTINALSKDGIILGESVRIGDNTVIECTGTLGRIGKGIKIGDRTAFGSNCFFGAAGGIEVGNDVIAGQNIRFHSENHNYDDLNILIRLQGVTNKGIKVGNNCWLGAGTVFLDGVTIGNGCVIAANSVVVKNIPDNAVYGGIPARFIKWRT